MQNNEYLGYDTKIGILDPKGINLNPLTNKPYTQKYHDLVYTWEKLPGYTYAKEIINSIANNQLTIAIMGTGTGKSVLIPKFALHYTNYEGKVLMTLPKRILALSTAEFASETLDVTLGKEVGYIYKGQNMSGPDNKIVYVTDGVLVMKMTKDPDLSEFKVIIIDEAHERKVQIDLILLFLKNLLLSGRRPDLKVILMSATIDGKKYLDYFGFGNIITVAGKPNHPIKTNFLSEPTKDYVKTGLEIINQLEKEKIKRDMLFFITTSKEAIDTCKVIRSSYPKVYCIEVYADMDSSLKIFAQNKDKYLELGEYDQKLVLATNVAESSLTIDGLKYVIDSCYELFSYFDPDSNGNILESRLISKAQALQRRGRVGRTEPGICYHLLTEVQFNNLKDYSEPDILKSDITIELIKIISQTKNKNFTDGFNVINQLMDIPKQTYVDYSYNILKLYKILDENNYLEKKISSDILQFSSLPINQSLFLIFAYQLYSAKEASYILGMMDVTKNNIQNIFYKTDPTCSANKCDKHISKPYLRKMADKKGDHFTFLNIFMDYKSVSSREIWAKKHGIQLNKLKKADQTASQLYRKIVSSNAPQIGGMKDVNTKKKLLECLKRSHLHLTATKLMPEYAKVKHEGNIKQNSSLKINYDKKQLLNKKIIYDELSSINGKWEFSVITIIK